MALSRAHFAMPVWDFSPLATADCHRALDLPAHLGSE
jgi:hypothetical protein